MSNELLGTLPQFRPQQVSKECGSLTSSAIQQGNFVIDGRPSFLILSSEFDGFVKRATTNAEKEPKVRQSRGVWGRKKLNAKTRTNNELNMTWCQRP